VDGLFAPPLEMFRPSSGVDGNRLPILSSRRLQRRHDQIGAGRQRLTDRLSFAVLPDAATAEDIADRARRLRLSHGLTGKPLQKEHFHVTLFHVGDAVCDPPTELVEMLTERAAKVVMPSFRVAFDRVMSFRNGALVLSGDDSVIGLEVLQQRLSDVLDGRPRPARPFTPHLTLLRDSQRIAKHPIEPISWTVREVMLVHSLLGRTTHRHLARLPLVTA
jgi:RNA 2',3'-cyclic 3'-phosphodiesterase